MPESCTVVIAPGEVIESLLRRRTLGGEVLAFAEQEAHEALGTIVSRWPELIVLGRGFASTSRGAELAECVRTYPLLAASRILVVEADGSLAPFEPARAGEPVAQASGGGAGATDTGILATAGGQPVERVETRTARRAPRVPIKPNVGVLIDGKEAVLVDLSVLGAQVLSPTVVRPNKPVRVVMPDRETLVKVNGVIVWARFEMLHGRPMPQYRAGISFTDSNPEAVFRYCERLRMP